MTVKIKYIGWLFSLILIFGLHSCESDDELDIFIEEEETVEQEPRLERLTSEEIEFITNILKVDAATQELFKGYNGLLCTPIYIVTGENQGIYINPAPSQQISSVPILNEIEGFEDAKLYRNELMYLFAAPTVRDSYWNWPVYEGETMFVYNPTVPPSNNFYTQYKDRNGYFHNAVFAHELFHVYSLFKNGTDYTGEGNYIQDFEGRTITEESLPYSLLLFYTMIDAYTADTAEEQRKFLEYYVSIHSKLLTLDSTPENFSRSHALYVEKVEGVARYIEVFGTLQALGNNTIEDPTHGYREFGENAQTLWDVQSTYNFRIYYHSGAAATFLLNGLEYENLTEALFVPTNTLYDISERFLNLSTNEKDLVLENAKDEYNWNALQKRSTYLLTL